MNDLKLDVVPRDLYYHEVEYVRKLEFELSRLRAEKDKLVEALALALANCGALRSPVLPSEEEIARIICGTCDVTRTNDGTFEQKYVCEVVIDCDCCMAKARAVLALLARSKGCT